jgi:phosphatidylserine/phosphatidylglycerophosphate/cardiolipin synthase-like enzyme
MQDQELAKFLQQTLDDFRMSRAEKQDLAQRLANIELDKHRQTRCHSLAFDIARGSTEPANADLVLDWLEEVTKVLRRASEEERTAERTTEALFSPGDHCPNRIGGLLQAARSRVEICVFTITDDRITSEILAAHRRGVTLRVITDNEKAYDIGSDTQRLSEAGVPLKIDRTPNHMHHKFALFDRKQLLTGSYNWTRSAAQYNEENFIVTDDRSLIVPFEREFDRLWDTFDPF